MCVQGSLLVPAPVHRVFPCNERGHCTVLLHPIMPLAPQTLRIIQPCQDTALSTQTHAHPDVNCAANVSLTGWGGNAAVRRAHTPQHCLFTVLRHAEFPLQEETRPGYKQLRAGEKAVKVPELHRGPASPRSRWERARAAAPSHPGSVLRLQPAALLAPLLDNLLSATSRHHNIYCVRVHKQRRHLYSLPMRSFFSGSRAP